MSMSTRSLNEHSSDLHCALCLSVEMARVNERYYTEFCMWNLDHRYAAFSYCEKWKRLVCRRINTKQTTELELCGTRDCQNTHEIRNWINARGEHARTYAHINEFYPKTNKHKKIRNEMKQTHKHRPQTSTSPSRSRWKVIRRFACRNNCFIAVHNIVLVVSFFYSHISMQLLCLERHMIFVSQFTTVSVCSFVPSNSLQCVYMIVCATPASWAYQIFTILKASLKHQSHEIPLALAFFAAFQSDIYYWM